jgi:methylase of polypeptide subunit release factors
LYERLFKEIIKKDIKFGVLIGEFGYGQRVGMEKLLNKYFDQKWEIEKDLAGIDRMFIIKI